MGRAKSDSNAPYYISYFEIRRIFDAVPNRSGWTDSQLPFLDLSFQLSYVCQMIHRKFQVIAEVGATADANCATHTDDSYNAPQDDAIVLQTNSESCLSAKIKIVGRAFAIP